MSHQGKYRALRAVNLIKEKWCGKIKLRMYVYGSFQRTYIPQEEATSPTIALEVLFVSLFFDSHYSIALETFGVPGAYVHASLPGDKVAYSGFLDIMCEVNPE